MTNENISPKPPIEVPWQQLQSSTLREVVESFILREGTDYGMNEVSLDRKREQIEKQLKSGQIKLVFDPSTETVTLMTKIEWQKNNSK